MDRSDSSARQEAMQQIVIHRRMIESYAFAITRDFHLAEDISQEVALVLVAQCDRLPAGDGFMPWLKEVIRRKSLELWRKQSRIARQLSPAAMAQVEAAFPMTPEDDLSETMAMCVDKLAGDARQAVLARYAENLDVPSIAARIGRTVQGAYAVLKRARLALEDCVERNRQRTGTNS